MNVLKKNTASQFLRVFAFNRLTNAPVTGDAANITAKLSKDWGARTATNDTNPTETESGFYLFTLTQAETNADNLQSYPVSATANVQVICEPILIVPTEFHSISGAIAALQGKVVLHSTTIDEVLAQTSFTIVDPIATGSILTGAAIVITAAGDATQRSISTVSSFSGAGQSIELLSDPSFAIQAGDIVDIYPVAPVKVAATGINNDSFAANAISAAKIATGAFTAAKFAADAISSAAVSAAAVSKVQSGLATAAALASVAADVALVLLDTAALQDGAMDELTSHPGATPTRQQALMAIFMKLFNEETSDAVATIKNAAGDTIMSAALSDDGATFTKGKYENPS